MKPISLFVFMILLITPYLGEGTRQNKSQDIVNNVVILTDDIFDKSIKKGVVLVDFWAWWCGPCRIQSPIIDEIAGEIGQKATIAKMDVDKNPQTSARFNIQYIPSILVFKDGKLVQRLTGLQEKETLVGIINNLQN